MRSGQRRGRGLSLRPSGLLWAVWTCAIALSLTTSAAHAAPRVAYIDPHDAVLSARIRGQTQDLPLRLQLVRVTATEPPTQLSLQVVGRAEHADFVVQVSTRSDGAHVVYVYDAQLREVRVRETPAPARSDRFSRSASAETVALIVRGELTNALAARKAKARGEGTEAGGVHAGTPEPSTAQPTVTQPIAGSGASEPPPTHTTNPNHTDASSEPTKPVTHIAEPAAGARGTDTQSDSEPDADDGAAATNPVVLTLGLGARGSIAGPQSALLGLVLTLQLRTTHAVFGVALHRTLRDRIDTDAVLIYLQQSAVSAVGMGRWQLLPQLELDLGANAGITFYERSSRKRDLTDVDWSTTGDRTSFSAHLGLTGELRWAFTHSLGLSVLCGITFLLRPVRFEYGYGAEPSANMRDQLSHLSTLEPWVALSLSADLLSF